MLPGHSPDLAGPASHLVLSRWDTGPGVLGARLGRWGAHVHMTVSEDSASYPGWLMGEAHVGGFLPEGSQGHKASSPAAQALEGPSGPSLWGPRGVWVSSRRLYSAPQVPHSSLPGRQAPEDCTPVLSIPEHSATAPNCGSCMQFGGGRGRLPGSLNHSAGVSCRPAPVPARTWRTHSDVGRLSTPLKSLRNWNCGIPNRDSQLLVVGPDPGPAGAPCPWWPRSLPLPAVTPPPSGSLPLSSPFLPQC